MSPDQVLLPFLKALADPTRLRIVGLLSLRPHAVEELATVLKLRASTVSHHLGKLQSAGLLHSEVQGHYHLYALDLEALQSLARRLASADEVRSLAQVDEDADPYDRKVLTAFLDEEGRIEVPPMKRKKFDVLLRHALRLFEDEGPWTEREVNERLKGLTRDTATFRRGFIDHGYMTRDSAGQVYQRRGE